MFTPFKTIMNLTHSKTLKKLGTPFRFEINILLLLSFCLIVYALSLSIHRGLVYADEAFYLRAYDNQLYFRYSWFDIYAGVLKDCTLSQIRMTTIFLMFLSTNILAYGLCYYNKIRFSIWHVILSLIITFTFTSPVNYVINYVSLNYIIIQSVTGLLCMAVSQSNTRVSYTIMLSTGVLFSQLTFIMLTNNAFLLIIIPFIAIHFKNYFIAIIYFLLGILLGWGVFIFFIYSWDELLKDINELFNGVSPDNTHGLKPIIFWIYQTCLFFIKSIIGLGLLIYFSIKYFFSKNKNLKLVLNYSLLIIVVSNLFLDYINNSTDLINSSITYAFIWGILLHQYLDNYEMKKISIGIIFFFLPIVSSLGTNVNFELRSSVYITSISLYVIYYLTANNLIYLSRLFFFYLFLCVIRFSFEFTNGGGWGEINFAKQTEKICRFNSRTDILMDSDKIKTIETFQKFIPKNSIVYVGSADLHGYAYILDLNSRLLYFDYNDKFVTSFFEKNKSLVDRIVYLIENNTKPFPYNSFFDKHYKSKLTLFKDNNFTIYKCILD